MEEQSVNFTDSKNLDEAFVSAASGDLKSLQRLTRSLAEAKPRQLQLWPAEVRSRAITRIRPA